MNIITKLRQPFVLEKIRNGEWKNSPLVVEWDLTTACNLACPGCISEELMAVHGQFSSERIMEIAQDLVDIGVKAVILIGGGEPLAHPKAGDLIEFLGEHDVHVGITTNGFFIPKYLETIAKFSKWTRVSMDAATQQTFDALRPSKDGKSKFNAIIDGMKQLAKIKTGTLGFSFLIRTEADGFGIQSNIHEIFDAAVLARDIGCDYVEFKPSYSYVGDTEHALVKHSPQRMNEARKELERLKEVEAENFRVIFAINLKDSLDGVETPQFKDYHFCPAAYLRTLITPYGIYVCPYWRGKDRFCVGDPQHDSIKTIWKSARRKKIMDSLDPTVKCNFHCLRNETNQEIIRLMNETNVEKIKEYDRFI